LGATLAGSLVACAAEPSFLPNDPASEDRAEELALRYARQDASFLDGIDDVKAVRVFIDKDGRPHTTLQQTFAGVPVFGAEAIVHLDRDGGYRSVTDDLARNLRVDMSSNLSADKAQELAVTRHGGWSTVTGTPATDEQILQTRDGAVLTYRVAFSQMGDISRAAMPVVFIDAKTGDTVMEYDNLKHQALDDADKVVFDAGNRTNTKKPLPTADSSDATANEIYTNVGKALEYYQNVQGRDSYDGAGAQVVNYVHYDTNYVNAYWDGSSLTFGDGDGDTSGPLTTLDIVAHELSHGVCEHTANLTYQNESGALNEANSDIMAAAVEARDGASTTDVFLVGEDTWTPNTAGDALRYMCDPAEAGDVDYYFDRYTGSSDNGGVHSNSGIANLFFCLVSQGGTHPRGKSNVSVTGIGIDKAADMWYLALSGYMTSSTNYDEARTATLSAAGDLGFTADEVQSVDDAWAAVGVGVAAPPPLDYTTIDSQSLSGAQGSETQLGPYNSAGYKEMLFALSGGSGDADLYVKKGSAPTTSDYDCRPYVGGNEESCKFATDPAAGEDFYVMISGYRSYSSVSYSAQGGRDPVPECTVDSDCSDGDSCTLNSCDANGMCVTAPAGYDPGTDTCCTSDSECGTSDVCTTYTCNADGSCSATDTGVCGQCTADSECDDGDSCTDDSCDANGICQNVDNGSCNVCVPSKQSCTSNDECCSGNCRTKGKWAGTCS
jgi:vibriolysin